MAEIELSALVRQCLNRRIPDQDMLDAEAKLGQKNVMKYHLNKSGKTKRNEGIEAY